MTIWDSMTEERKQQEGEALMGLANAGVMVIHYPATPRTKACSELCLWHALNADGDVVDGGSASALKRWYDKGNLSGIVAVQRCAEPGEPTTLAEEQRQLFLQILDEHWTKRRAFGVGDVVAALSLMALVGVLLWVFIAYTNVPR